MTNEQALRIAFNALETHQIIRIQAHTEAWGVVSPDKNWTNPKGSMG